MTDDPDGRLDKVDVAILDQVRAAYAAADSRPADLDGRVRFASVLESVDIEVARLQEDVLVGSGTRSAERTRTTTFDAESLTIMVSIVDLPDDLVRLDGWLAPPGAHRVELRLGTTPDQRVASWLVDADDGGRFVFSGVGRGLAQLLVQPAPDSGGGPTTSVVTPSMVL
jgi:hypothetical protein